MVLHNEMADGDMADEGQIEDGLCISIKTVRG